MSETDIQQRVRLALSRGPMRLFRNNSGMAWLGKATPLGPQSVRLDQARKVRLGLGVEGSSDLIGWQSVTVTEMHVGTVMGVIVALEVKDRGSLTTEQENWLRAVHAAGGRAGVARGPDAVVWL